jgi:hypothetical protein
VEPAGRLVGGGQHGADHLVGERFKCSGRVLGQRLQGAEGVLDDGRHGLFGVLGQRLQGPPGALRERLQDGGRPPAEGQDQPGRAAQRLRQAKVGGRVGARKGLHAP